MRKNRKSELNYKNAIYKVGKQVNRSGVFTISSKGMEVVNDIVVGMAGKIASTAREVMLKDDKMTMTSRHIQTAVKLHLSGELLKHAVNEGLKHVTRFISYQSENPRSANSYNFAK